MSDLIAAIHNGNIDAVLALSQKDDFDVNVVFEKSGATPLIIALCNGRAEIAQFLFDLGADVDISIQRGARTPAISLALRPYFEDEFKIEMIKKMNDPNAHDTSGRTPLHEAILHDEPRSVVTALIDIGTDLYRKPKLKKGQLGYSSVMELVSSDKLGLFSKVRDLFPS